MTEDEWLACDDPAAMRALLPKHHVSDRKLRLWVQACRSASGASGPWANNLGAAGELHAAVASWTRSDAVSWMDPHQRPPLSVRADLLRDVVGNPFRPVTLPRVQKRKPCPDCAGTGFRSDRSTTGPGLRPCSCNPAPGNRLFGYGTVWADDSCPWVTPEVLSLARAAHDEPLPGRTHKKCRCGREFTALQKKGLSPPLAWCNHCAEDGGWYVDVVAQNPDGRLDPARLAVLADALEEAGCPQTERCDKCEGTGVILTDGPNYLFQSHCRYCGGEGKYPDGKNGCGKVPHPLLVHLRSPDRHVQGCWALDLVLGKEF